MELATHNRIPAQSPTGRKVVLARDASTDPRKVFPVPAPGRTRSGAPGPRGCTRSVDLRSHKDGGILDSGPLQLEIEPAVDPSPPREAPLVQSPNPELVVDHRHFGRELRKQRQQQGGGRRRRERRPRFVRHGRQRQQWGGRPIIWWDDRSRRGTEQARRRCLPVRGTRMHLGRRMLRRRLRCRAGRQEAMSVECQLPACRFRL